MPKDKKAKAPKSPKPVKKAKQASTKASAKKAEKKPKKDVKVEKPKSKEKSKKTDYGSTQKQPKDTVITMEKFIPDSDSGVTGLFDFNHPRLDLNQTIKSYF